MQPLKILWIHEQLYADFDQGKVYWKINKRGPGAKVGKEAGTVRDDGYYQIKINGRFVRRSHVIWGLKYGQFPVEELDHIDRNPSNDSIHNLREATSSENKANQKLQSNNKCGLKGVYLRKDNQKWTAQICSKGVRRTLGLFSSKEQAYEAYREYAIKLHGEFATV